MARRLAAVLGLATILSAGLLAHAGLRFSNPMEGATLGDTPSIVQLTMGEKPEPALSSIHVIDTAGVRYDVGAPAAVAGDPLSLSVSVRSLGTGVYTVNWRVVSAVDGHATTGAYAFGVRASPAGVAAAETGQARITRFEVAARWILLAGLIVLLGAAWAAAARFGGPGDLPLAAAGWLLSAGGLGALFVAQTQTAGGSASDLLSTSIGRALLWRAAALAVAAVALAAASRTARQSPRRLAATTAVALAALATIGIHVAAGHAAAGRFNILATVAVQWAHFAASAIWLGGLGALLLGLRGAPSGLKAIAIRRFSTFAAASIVVVLATGLARAYQELASWSELTTTPYGRTLLAKSALFGAIAILGAINRWRGVPKAQVSLRPLRVAATAELLLAAAALVAASLLGTLPPPAATRAVPGITASGVDYATTVRVTLSAASDQPGPNRFVARIVDYDSRKPVNAERVTLRFTPLDDPDLPATALSLAPDPDGAFAGSGANLSFDGRWQVKVVVARDGNSVEVPLNVDVRGRAHTTRVVRVPGQPVWRTVDVRGAAILRFSADPERAGRSRVQVTCFDFSGDERPVSNMVVTLTAAGSSAQQVPLRRSSAGTFEADVELAAGTNTIAAVARTTDGTRVRAAVDIEVPGR